MKTCFKCNTRLPSSDFYAHKGMKDGLLNKCKSCTKNDVKKHREKNIGRIRAYDRNRGNRQDPEYLHGYRKRNAIKYRATTAVNNALRDGKLTRNPTCESCGNNSEHAHHDDYTKPLDVRWLCAACHLQWHSVNGSGKTI